MQTASAPPSETRPPDATRPSRLAGAAPLANVGLGLYLLFEGIYGVLSEETDLDRIWWVVVTTILVINVILRSPAIEKDTRWWVWILCAVSLLHPLAFDWGDESALAGILLIAIFLLGDIHLIYLGRSFAILPARRTIRTGGLYRFVRHPIYSCYILAEIVYLTQFPSVRNVAIFAVATILFGVRAILEERLLSNDPAYREYAARTRWRFLPFLF